MSDMELSREQLLQELAVAQQTIAMLEQTIQSLSDQSSALPPHSSSPPSPAVVFRTLSRLIQQLPIGIQIFNVDGLCIDVNEAHQQIFGVSSRDDIVGRGNLFTNPDSQKYGIGQCGQRALQGEVVQLPELHLGHRPQPGAAQKPLIVCVTVFPIRDALNNVVQIVVLTEDITERTLVKQTAQQTEQKYKTLVEQLPAITYTMDLTQSGVKPIYISPQVKKLLGFSVAEWLDNPELWVKQLHPKDKARVLAEVQRRYPRGKGLDMEYRVQARDGQTKWFRDQNTIIFDGNRPRLAHGIMFDITQQKTLETQLRQIQRMEAVGQMAGGMAHNFNNILTSILGHAELALFTLGEEHPTSPDLLAISKSTTRAAELTRQLLAFTRNQEVKAATINLSEILFEIGPLLKQLVPNEFEFTLKAAPDLWNIKADPNQIEQILVNLVVNARDALERGGQITVQTANQQLPREVSAGQQRIPPGQYVLLSVSDTGSGIPDEVMPHIFEPFFTTKEVGQGTGLGLSACFGIVQHSQGIIIVDSAPGQGTAFKIYFPRAAPPKETTAARSVPIENISPPENMGPILLVDDTFMVREMSARILRQRGFLVVEAASGQDALELLSHPDLAAPAMLITDVSMPVVSGIDLAQQVLQLYPGTKVLFISGHSDWALEDRGINKMKHGVLTKPFTPNTLLKAVAEVLNTKP